MTVGRTSAAPELSQRDTFAAWDDAIVASGLPVWTGDPAKPKPRLAFGAPLSVGMVAEAELIDVVLTERLPAWQVREGLAPRIPAGWTLEDLADVWLGGPPLAGRVVAADYRVTLGGPVNGAQVEAAASGPARCARDPAGPRQGRRHRPLRPAAAPGGCPGRDGGSARRPSGSGPDSTRNSARAGRRRSSSRSRTSSASPSRSTRSSVNGSCSPTSRADGRSGCRGVVLRRRR